MATRVCVGKPVQVGNKVRVYGSYSNTLDPVNPYNPIDPTDVFVTVREPDGSETVYEYEVDPEVVRESAGEYYIEVLLHTAGRWYFKWWSTGPVYTATEVELKVLNTVTAVV